MASFLSDGSASAVSVFPADKALWLITAGPELSETAACPPEGKEPIEWFLMTNEPVNTVEDAYKCVENY
jgi:hypothetical protein